MEELFKNMHLQLSAEDIRKIDKWKISHGMKSRTEAIRAMIRIVVGGEVEETPLGGMYEKKASDFMRPDVNLSKKEGSNETLEEMVRLVVKQELQKILNNK